MKILENFVVLSYLNLHFSRKMFIWVRLLHSFQMRRRRSRFSIWEWLLSMLIFPLKNLQWLFWNSLYDIMLEQEEFYNVFVTNGIRYEQHSKYVYKSREKNSNRLMTIAGFIELQILSNLYSLVPIYQLHWL